METEAAEDRELFTKSSTWTGVSVCSPEPPEAASAILTLALITFGVGQIASTLWISNKMKTSFLKPGAMVYS